MPAEDGGVMSETTMVFLVIAAAVLAEALLIVLVLSLARRRDEKAKNIVSALSAADKQYLVRTPPRRTSVMGVYLPALCIEVKEKSRGAVVGFVVKDELYNEYRNSQFRIVKVRFSKDMYAAHPMKRGDRTFVLIYGSAVKVGFDVK